MSRGSRAAGQWGPRTLEQPPVDAGPPLPLPSRRAGSGASQGAWRQARLRKEAGGGWGGVSDLMAFPR